MLLIYLMSSFASSERSACVHRSDSDQCFSQSACNHAAQVSADFLRKMVLFVATRIFQIAWLLPDPTFWKTPDPNRPSRKTDPDPSLKNLPFTFYFHVKVDIVDMLILYLVKKIEFELKLIRLQASTVLAGQYYISFEHLICYVDLI